MKYRRMLGMPANKAIIWRSNGSNIYIGEAPAAGVAAAKAALAIAVA